MEEQSEVYQRRRDVLVDGLAADRLAGRAAQGGHVRLGEVPEPWASQMSSMDFAMKLLDEADVAVSPGSGFGAAGEGFLRLALVENEKRLRQAVRQIGRCLDREAKEHLVTGRKK